MSEQTLHQTGLNTRSPDPWTEDGYADWQLDPFAIRRQWMEMMGLSQDEIDENCELDPPTDIDEELSQYNAMFVIQDINARN